jgi:hypothetical protein
MKFSVIHPTARVTPDFENPWWMAAYAAFNGADFPQDIEYILVVHVSRMNAFCANAYRWGWSNPEKTLGRFVVVTNYGRDCLVDQRNAGYLAATGEIQRWNHDDMRYPEHWDAEILKSIADTSQPQPYAVQAHADGGCKGLLMQKLPRMGAFE